MKLRTLVLDGREYVLVPRSEWEAQGGRNVDASGASGYTIGDVRFTLAQRVVAMRKQAGWSQAELARRAGVRVETISRLENGLHMPGARTFEKIERAVRRARVRRAG
jgi:DNA-binding XRE family transcriptional regulator